MKVEDGQALNRFAIFLMRCKNAMESSRNLTKLEQPETMKKLSLKLPFSLRVRWRRLVDEIMEDQGRAIRFNDLAEFVDHEARVATNPLFGKIVEDSRPRPDTRRGLLNKGSHEKTKQLSDLTCYQGIAKFRLTSSRRSLLPLLQGSSRPRELQNLLGVAPTGNNSRL